MKSKTVTTVASNDESVRLRIYEGDLPLEDSTTELVRVGLMQEINALKVKLQEAERSSLYWREKFESACAS